MTNELGIDNSKMLNEEDIKAQRAKSDLVSKKLGELLLKGYRMLDASCTNCGCILMQLKNQPTYCVNCEEIEIKKKPVQIVDIKPIVKTEQQIVPKLNYQLKKESNDEDATLKISELLLKGYKMLNATCEECHTILMQKRNEVPICVLCVDHPKILKVETKHNQEDFDEKPKKIIKTNSIESKFEMTSSDIQSSNEIECALIEKIQWATGELRISANVKQNIELCELIKVAADALASVKICFKK